MFVLVLTIFIVEYIKVGFLFGQRDLLPQPLLSHFLLVGLALIEMSPPKALQVFDIPQLVIPRVAPLAAYLHIVDLFGHLFGQLLLLELNPALAERL